MFAEDLCHRIEDQLEIFFPTFDLDFETAAQAHRKHIEGLNIQWDHLRTYRTCLLCLRRKPEHTSSCKHAICDICVVIFGSQVPGREAHFVLDPCLLCRVKGKMLVRLKPPTAGARILSIDGGGVRGVVPLEFLNLLQGLLEPPLLLQDLFEQAFGTSSGKTLDPGSTNQPKI